MKKKYRIYVSAATLLAVVIPSLSDVALAQMVGGPGPSVLSRGGNRSGQRGEGLINFTFFGGLSGTYDSGVFTTVDAADGEVTPQALYGGQALVGAYGSHGWRRSVLGLDYRGDFRRYPNRDVYNGSDQALSLEYGTLLTRRWEFIARTNAGTMSRTFGGFAAPQFLATDYVSLPLYEVYYNRIYYGQAMAYAGYRKSARTLYTLGGGGYTTRRTASGLVGTNGALAVGSVEHRLSRDHVIGAAYNYMHFSFPRAFGTSDTHGANLIYRRLLGRYSEFTLQAGMYRLESLGSESFTLSPEVAAILGRPTGVRAFYKINYFPQWQGDLSFRKKQMSYSLGYRRGITPGNGLYLTSQGDTASGGVSYTGIRRTSMGVNAGYTRFKSIWMTTQDYNMAHAGGGFSYLLPAGFNIVFQADFRRTNAGTEVRDVNGKSVTLGLTWSSADRPLSLW